MSDRAGANEIAHDIRDRAATLFKYPNDEDALKALHADSQQLARNKDLQNQVIKELHRLETQSKKHHLPEFVIEPNGQIECSQQVGHRPEIKTIMIHADPQQYTAVWSIRVGVTNAAGDSLNPK